MRRHHVGALGIVAAGMAPVPAIPTPQNAPTEREQARRAAMHVAHGLTLRLATLRTDKPEARAAVVRERAQVIRERDAAVKKALDLEDAVGNRHQRRAVAAVSRRMDRRVARRTVRVLSAVAALRRYHLARAAA